MKVFPGVYSVMVPFPLVVVVVVVVVVFSSAAMATEAMRVRAVTSVLFISVYFVFFGYLFLVTGRREACGTGMRGSAGPGIAVALT